MTQVQTIQRLHKAAPVAAFAIRDERSADGPAREALLDAAFGIDREARTCQRLRDGRAPARGLSFAATVRGRLVGTVRLWHVAVGGRPALVLGPLAVDAAFRDLGIGAALMRHALAKAAALGHDAVLLLGDAPYYARFGFSAEKTGALALPGSYDPARLLGCELIDGALDGVAGMIQPTGQKARRPRPVKITAAAESPDAGVRAA